MMLVISVLCTVGHFHFTTSSCLRAGLRGKSLCDSPGAEGRKTSLVFKCRGGDSGSVILHRGCSGTIAESSARLMLDVAESVTAEDIQLAHTAHSQPTT